MPYRPATGEGQPGRLDREREGERAGKGQVQGNGMEGREATKILGTFSGDGKGESWPKWEERQTAGTTSSQGPIRGRGGKKRGEEVGR